MKISVDTFCNSGESVKGKKGRKGQGDKEKRGQGDRKRFGFPRQILSLYNSPFVDKWRFLCLLVVLSPLLPVFFSACGKIGDPLPPIPRAKLNIEELSVEQQGTNL